MHLNLFFRRLALLTLIAGAGGAFYYFWLRPSPFVTPAPKPSSSPEARVIAPSTIRYPVPSERVSPGLHDGNSALRPLPTLDNSDPTLTEALRALLGTRFEALFIKSGIVQRIVVTVDSATGRKQPSADFLPLLPPDSDFVTSGNGDKQTISAANFKRYSPYVALLQSLDPKRLVTLYIHFYPLFQSAYLNLGTPGYFNDRLVEVLDTLLATPEPSVPIAVGRASLNGRLKYSDDHLEQLPAAQKLMIRTGPDHENIIKSKLRELRALLVHLGR